MNKYIKFNSGIKLSEPIGLRFTQKFYEEIRQSSFNVRQVVDILSRSSTLLLTKYKEENMYILYTSFGDILCSSADEDGNVSDNLTLIDLFPLSLDGQNRALTYGICFEPAYIIVRIYLKGSYNISCEIVRGKQYPAHHFKSSTAGIIVINNEMAKEKNPEENFSQDSEQDYKPDRRLARLLNIAENYSVISYSMEKIMVNRIGDIPYEKIVSSEYNRLDRLSYDLIVGKIDESLIKKGTMIDINDKLGDRHSAEIWEINKEGDGYRLSVLFSDHVDIGLFSSIGWFNLTFSSVNRDVQLEANEKIRNGESAAKYMDNILGKHEPQKYVVRRIPELESELKKKKYPPNESQVKAIISGISCPDVFLVMGPPGTGKTTVILEWVKYFVLKEHKRVLISSQNNKAVDNVIARIADEEGIDIIRIGSETKVETAVKPFLFENKLVNKRKEIVQDTQRNLDTILELADRWIIYSNSLYNLYDEQQSVLEKKQAFQSFVEKEISVKYDRLISLSKEDRAVKKEKTFLHTEILRLYDAITSSEKSQGVIGKFIGKLSHHIHASTMEKRVAEYDYVCQRELTIVTEYNSLRETLNTSLTDAYELFKDYSSSAAVLKEKARKIINEKPDTPNIWNLFEDIHFTEEMIPDGLPLKKILEKIQSEYSRSLSISSVIEEWQEKTENQQNYALNKVILESVNLVGATCIGINSQKKFSDLDFDVTIIDEAGQIQIHNALVPMSVSNKLIMLGDHKQIPPSVDQDMLTVCKDNMVSTEYLEKSLFEKMYEFMPTENKIMLDTQYRMPKEIADTISDWFYAGEYHSPDFKRNQKSLLPKISLKPFVFIDTSRIKGRYEKKIPNEGCNNEFEASIIVSLVKDIVNHSELDIRDVGIISAYNAQVKLIKSSLVQNGIMAEEVANDVAATLDSFQGQERDIILYSFTRSSRAPGKNRRIGFLNELRRLNVAMTRCKKNLILIGDLDFLISCENNNPDEDGEPVYQGSEKQFSDFMKHVKENLESGAGEIIPYPEFVRRMKQ